MHCMARQDRAYKLLFSQPRMVEDALCGFAIPRGSAELDFSTLTRMNAEYVGPDLHSRIGDMLWRVEFTAASPLAAPPLANGARPYLLVMFEFQSAVDPDMAWRMHEYLYLLQRHQRSNGTLRAEGREPPVLAVVVHNGDRPWTAADVRAGPVVEAPAGPGWAGNRTRTYVALDLRELAGRGAGLPPDNRLTTLIGLETGPAETLPERLRAAFERYGGEEEKGLREGYHARVRDSRSPHGGEGLASFPEFERALERKRGGAEMPTLMDARAMEWEARVMERGREQGREQGIAQGREQGIAQGRAEGWRELLRRQAERRFGPETAAQLAGYMAETAGVEELLQVGDWILDCGSGRELLDRFHHARDA